MGRETATICANSCLTTAILDGLSFTSISTICNTNDWSLREALDFAVMIVQSEKDSARGYSLSAVGEEELPDCRCLPEELSVLFHIVLEQHSLESLFI